MTSADTPILKQLQQRKGNRRRRRATTPAWALWLMRVTRIIGLFFRRTLPQYLRQHQVELKTGAASFAIHLLVVLLLAFWVLPRKSTEEFFGLLATVIPDDNQQLVEIQDLVQPEVLLNLNADSNVKQMLSDLEHGLTSENVDNIVLKELQIPLDALSDRFEIPVNAGDFGGRSTAGRQAAVRQYGGTGDSEKAVNAGLKWLQSIQQPDGSWSFGKVGEAGSPGSMDTTDMGATSMALLCFLGAGHTHRAEGDYQKVVESGLSYLMKNAVRQLNAADLRGNFQGNSGLYVQGIATMCICEASALVPDDKELRKLAIEAVSFVERSRDPVGGGWRYEPRQPGDTSVVGWQLMALQSARAGKIRVSGSALRDARQFLQSVQADGGAQYGYMRPQKNRQGTTAVGLLCRMYLGWKREHSALKRGVDYLAARGPDREDMYYNYYATQVMHHFGGEVWDQWNVRMRQQLVETQIQDGPGAGSWDVTDPHGSSGGRIYQTALSILTLEVYYRHLPIYRKLDSAQTDAELMVE